MMGVMGAQKSRSEEVAEVYRRVGTVKGSARELGLQPQTVREHLQKLGLRLPMAAPVVDTPDTQVVRKTSTLVDPSGQIKQQWVIAETDKQQMLEDFIRCIDFACARIPALDPVKAPTVKMEDIMCVIPLGDPHIGMLAWGEETGADWDLKLAESTFKRAIDHLVRIAPPASQCLLVNLGDYFHANDQRNVTPGHGHQLDVDSRHGRVLDVGLEIMRYMVERCLTKFSRVIVDNVRGNHDPEAYEILPRYLSAWFRNEPRIEIVSTPGLYHFHEFGANLIGTHHGHRKRKATELEAVMARRMPEAWGRTKARNRRFYVGHIHNDTSEFTGGCTVETHCTLAAPDAYAAGGGWDSDRNVKLDILHREHGLTARHILGLDQIMAGT